ncbi:hypothetical protein BGW38_002429 [Lunasporangiospora selenospora]|uniref:Actin-like ATPase domain-containing protein n=1 Tax=Lunasporangiospora selenospora TaxID=979761 RepID=A0A9P6FSK9_9FUNG|nr:hypothetical protein BGW38_002429 [Lunasporangiospora selenospora]
MFRNSIFRAPVPGAPPPYSAIENKSCPPPEATVAKEHKEYDPKEHPILIAIDFGTTFSPRQPAKYSKTPTLSLYEIKRTVDTDYKLTTYGWSDAMFRNNPNNVGRNDRSWLKLNTWGWNAKLQAARSKDNVILQKFKLQLDEDYCLQHPGFKIDTVQAIADYLEPFHEYVTEAILKGFGDGFSSDKFRYCLTVPAMWSDKAKNAMRQAAIRANLIRESDHLDRLMLVTEPEAAALYCQLKCDQFSLGNKDRFMICDAGGGTVDLIVYEIEETSSGKRLSEVTKGHGASCGSTFVDQNFEKLLVKKFATQGITLPPKVLAKVMEKFIDDIKPLFDGETEHHLDLPSNACFEDIPNEAAIGVDDGTLILDTDELREKVFDPVVVQVFELIDQQLVNAKSCSTIFLVGGFGSSEYLLRKVKEQFLGRVSSVNVPQRAELAVVRGAVYAGLEPKTVTVRVARRWYGLVRARPFRTGIDPPSSLSQWPDGVYCNDRFSHMVEKGRRLGVDECVDTQVTYTKGVHTKGMVIIYAFNGDGQAPEHVTGNGMFKLGQISSHEIFMPWDPPGTKKTLTFKMYFGQSEIKAVLVVDGIDYDTSLSYEESA